MLLIGTLHCESFLEKKLDSVGLEYYLLGDLNFNLASLQYDLNTRRICEISDLCGMGFRAGNKNRRGLVFSLSLIPRVPQTACSQAIFLFSLMYGQRTSRLDHESTGKHTVRSN